MRAQFQYSQLKSEIKECQYTRIKLEIPTVVRLIVEMG